MLDNGIWQLYTQTLWLMCTAITAHVPNSSTAFKCAEHQLHANLPWQLAWTKIWRSNCDLTQGREEIEDVTNDPNRQPQQDMVEVLKEAEDATMSFYATQAGACWFTTQIYCRQRGYGICCTRNKPILALNQQENVSYKQWISNIFSFHKKGWLKILNMQWQNRLN